MDKIKRNIKPFNGEKYSKWKFLIRALLSEHNTLILIDENSGVLPEQTKKLEKMVKNIIIETLSDTFLGFASDDCTAREIFQKLDAIYEKTSLAELSNRKQLKGDILLVNHFNIFDDLYTELISADSSL